MADPAADLREAQQLYGICLAQAEDIRQMDAVILAVAHKEFEDWKRSDFDRLFGCGKKVLLDVKGILDRKEFEEAGYDYWRL